MQKKIFAPSLAFMLLLASASGLTSCDFGNKTNDVANQGAQEEGTIQAGDNADDPTSNTSGGNNPDTTGTGSFQ